MDSSVPEISLVIPTRNEADCIDPLLSRLARALQPYCAEIIFVDDSSDGTASLIERAAPSFGFEIRTIHRPPEAREGGLGGAVVAGIRAARAPWVCVMDADLQHPPEIIPELFETARSSGADLVAAGRDLRRSGNRAFSLSRAVTSRGLNGMLRLLFPGPLGKVNDPLSGLFVFRTDRIDPDRLVPRGYKILIDILVRHPELKVDNFSFEFQARHAGESKAGIREAVRFLHLLSGIWLVQNASLLRFLAVGLTGLLVNSALLALFVESGRMHYLWGAGLATQGSTLWNYMWTERWVFRGEAHRRPGLQRFAAFFLMNNLLLLVRAPVLGILVDWIGFNYLVANVVSIALVALTRFGWSRHWIWQKTGSAPEQREYFYDIHGIVRIGSTVRLPELESFLVETQPAVADLSVVVAPKETLNADPAAIEYDEGFGDAGFWLRIRTGDSTRVWASPLLGRSPHVLYTNVVEPVLRWTLVRKGYVLIHGACMAYQGRGLLISAATDTGKTTTILKSLAEYPFEFLSDDMVILDRDGCLYAYPKPLTISLHTLRAVPTAELSLGERLRLQIQSRIHSRLGRRLGILFGNIRLPAATLNAYLQIVVPPPKYRIERLIPGVRRRETARLAHLAVIERGPVHENILPQRQIFPILARNIEDAYGFPPYPQIAGSLSRSGERDLHQEEADLLRAVVEKIPAVYIHREEFDWWRRLPAVFYGELFGISDPISARYPTVPRDAVVKTGG